MIDQNVLLKRSCKSSSKWVGVLSYVPNVHSFVELSFMLSLSNSTSCLMKFVSPSCLLASAQEGSNCQSIITACITVSTSSGGLLYALISPRSFFVKGFQSLHRGTKSVCRHDTCVRDENSSIAICTLTAYSSAGRASSRSFRVASAKCWQCNSSSAIFSLRAATVFLLHLSSAAQSPPNIQHTASETLPAGPLSLPVQLLSPLLSDLSWSAC